MRVRAEEKGTDTKGKRHTTEEKIRLLREVDGGRSVREVCQEKNISEATYHRWRKQFGLMEVNEAKRLKELERENSELKKMLAESLLKNRVLEARMRKKALSPANRREHAARLMASGVCSARAACRILKLARSTYRYRGRPPTEQEAALHRRLEELSKERPRFGYRRIAALLGEEGWQVGKRLVQRWRKHAGLRVPPTRKKQIRRGVSTGLPTKATHRGHVWTWDFIADATVRGGALRMLTILDEHTRECHVLRADRALKSQDVLEWLGRAIQEHGAPEHLRSDNGPEFIAKAVQQWLAERPHSRPGYLSPHRFAQRKHFPSPVPVGLRPPCTGMDKHKPNNNHQPAPRLSLISEQFPWSGQCQLRLLARKRLSKLFNDSGSKFSPQAPAKPP